MTVFVISVIVVLVVSAFCSVSEAALYAVRRPFVRQLVDQDSRAGETLSRFKENMERPIAAILIVNTIANTAGASVAGAQARSLFGDTALIWFSILFTLGVLFLSEIIPKIAGVAYHRPISVAIARIWAFAITMLAPVIWVIERLSRKLQPGKVLAAPEDEVRQLALISAEEGSIMPYEAELVANVLQLDQIEAKDIMTPAPVVMKFSEVMTLREVADKVEQFNHTRMPIFNPDNPDEWTRIVFSRDILSGLAKDRFDATLKSISVPIYFVSPSTRGHILLKSFLKRRTHLFGVADEFGNISGIVTLEDVIESMLGQEIVDEIDSAVDMRELAKRRHRERLDEQS